MEPWVRRASVTFMPMNAPRAQAPRVLRHKNAFAQSHSRHTLSGARPRRARQYASEKAYQTNIPRVEKMIVSGNEIGPIWVLVYPEIRNGTKVSTPIMMAARIMRRKVFARKFFAPAWVACWARRWVIRIIRGGVAQEKSIRWE